MEIEKIEERTNVNAIVKMKSELKKTLDVIKYLKRKVGEGNYDEEYLNIVEEIEELVQKKNK